MSTKRDYHQNLLLQITAWGWGWMCISHPMRTFNWPQRKLTLTKKRSNKENFAHLIHQSTFIVKKNLCEKIFISLGLKNKKKVLLKPIEKNHFVERGLKMPSKQWTLYLLIGGVSESVEWLSCRVFSSVLWQRLNYCLDSNKWQNRIFRIDEFSRD